METFETEIDEEMTEARLNRKRLISNQVGQLFLNKQTIYIDKLQELLENVNTPPALHFVQALSTNPEHCSAFQCYRNNHFTFSGSTLQITTQIFPLSPRTHNINMHFATQ